DDGRYAGDGSVSFRAAAARARSVQEPDRSRAPQQRPAILQAALQLARTRGAGGRHRGGDGEDEFRLDFPIRFARDLAGKLAPGKRMDQLRGSKPFLDKAQATEIASLSTDLSHLGIDWREPPKDQKIGPKVGDFEVRVETDRKDDSVVAGQPMTLRVTVKNKGALPFHQLRSVTKGDGGYYDEKELVFGRIEPGQAKTATAPMGWC